VKLTCITRIRGHRVFRDFSWPNDLHAFGQFNLVYGWNGCGKTTLSSLLAHVEKRAVLSEGEFELEFDGATKVSGTALNSVPLPQVRVFNRDFINATLQSAGSGIAPIYFLGEDNIEKQAQVDQLKSDLSHANTEVTTATSEKKAADTKLDDFCVAKAKLIKELLTTANSTGYNNYDKRRFKQAAKGMSVEAAPLALHSDDDKARLRSQKDAQPKSAIDELSAPSVDLSALKAEVEQLLGRSVVAQTIDELTQDTELGSWVQRGLTLHSGERHSDTCRFCQQPLDMTRRLALEAHFNDAFSAFQRDLGTMLSKLKTVRAGRSSLRLPETAWFYDHLVAEATIAVEAAKATVEVGLGSLDTLIACVESKRNNPFAVPVAGPDFTPADAGCLTNAIGTINAVIGMHNTKTDDFKRSVEQACKQLENAYVAESHAEYVQLTCAAELGEESLQRAKKKPKQLQAQIDELERMILEHRRPADELTNELRAYLGRDELRFEVKGSGYALTRGGESVAHLSEGERTAIAFLYFLKSLQDKTFDLANGIVVIDDPVSSLDANALFSAFAYMKERTGQCGQLFVFTHSFPFFRLVKNWFHHLARKKKGVPQLEVRSFQLHSRSARSSPRGARVGVPVPVQARLR
jgi:wobble nucleotide-excising tRNase